MTPDGGARGVDAEGTLQVRLAWDGTRVQAVQIASSRPLAIGTLLRGRTPVEARALIPRLYSLCRVAQEEAANAALAGAAGLGAGTDPAAARSSAAVRVVLETLQEHVWRLLLDWPQAVGLPGDTRAVAETRRLCATVAAGITADGRDAAEPLAALVAAAATQVFGQAPAAWLAQSDPAALRHWAAAGATLPARALDALALRWPGLGASTVPLMPGPAPAPLRDGVVPGLRADAGFARAPRWNGSPVETGPLARHRRHPLLVALGEEGHPTALVRFAARLVDLATLLVDLAALPIDLDAPTGGSPAAGIMPGAGPGVGLALYAQAAPFGWPTLQALALEPDEGLGAVSTARGLLLHRVRLAAGRVAEYDIVAPTEWNCHADGALAQGLRGLEASSRGDLVQAARIAVLALDPCVACTVEVVDA